MCLGSAIDSLSPQIAESPLGDAELFVLEGEFDASTSPKLEEQLHAAIERGTVEIVIDMCAVTFVDMSTLNVIARAMKQVYRRNGHLSVACAQRAVLRAIDLAGLRHAVRVYETQEDALAHLRDRVR